MENERRVAARSLLDLVQAIFETCEMGAGDAHLLADSLVDADLSGVHSHGVLRVPEYARKLTVDGVDPNGKPEVVKDNGACLVVDGGNSMGQIGTAFAMQQVIARAGDIGMAAAGIRGSNHCGAVGYFARMALDSDMIGIATTNALPTMAPWGGAERILGINPLSVAIPAGREFPIVFDAAFSGSAHGKIRVYEQKGLTLPEGWAMDADGMPTTDPVKAIDGLLMPIGQFKGVALALVMGIFVFLCCPARAMAPNWAIWKMDHRRVKMVILWRLFGWVLLKMWRDSGRGLTVRFSRFTPVKEHLGWIGYLPPGEPEALRRSEYRTQGIPLNAVTLNDLKKTAEERGLAFALGS